ncbi:MAG TPA: acetylglutamate kinase [Puia sp.]|uniref:acetylglutamate kinase n=1 Tax=Puia sp. TaxID=2045100 RepID=UPI002C31E2C7|nr:acetylglutamate kinase [Puia sp.]HVU97558.1 acetylglutamate kinase [Puia sp.]
MQLSIIKIGGNIIDDEAKLLAFLDAFAAAPGKKILVHGGGKLATKVAEGLGIRQQLVDGRRITDAETLRVVTMVYAGTINKNIVAQLQARGCAAIGLTGADGNAILSHKRVHPTVDYGFVGDVDQVNTPLLTSLLLQDKTIVFAPITHDGKGQLLNTNADTIAQELARALSTSFEVSLVYSFEKAGVLMDTENDASVIGLLRPAEYEDLKARKVIFAGMIPKLDNAFAALRSGVGRVIIGRAEELSLLLSGKAGTTIQHE